MIEEPMSPAIIWLISTQKPASNPTPKIKTVPVGTILLFNYCDNDPDKFEALTLLFEECFEAGRRYDFADKDLKMIASSLGMKADWHTRGLDFDNPSHEGYKNNEKSALLLRGLKTKVEGILNGRR